MESEERKRTPDYFGDDDDDVLDIGCRPALPSDLPQVAFLAAEFLESVFGPIVGASASDAVEFLLPILKSRLRHDCTWVIHEGNKVAGMIDIETTEIRRLNGLPIPRSIAAAMNLTERVRAAGLLPLLMHEPENNEAHQSLVAILPGSRAEGRGTLLLMHGAFWAKAQGKDWMTTWLDADDPVISVYKRRGYFATQEVRSVTPEGEHTWVLLKRPISPKALKAIR